MNTPQTATHRIAFGLDPTGRMQAVRDVPQGLRCRCVCPNCKKPLVARKGHIRVHHFAHAPSVTPCKGGAETALHRMAKQILAEADAIVLPAMTIWEPGEVAPAQSQRCRANVCPREAMPIQSRRIESTEDLHRPDVVISNGVKEVWIEVRVAHRVSEAKQDALREKGTACLEIDIRNFGSALLDEDELRYMLIEDEHCKVWLAHPNEAEVREKAKAEWDRKELKRQAQERERAERTRRETEARERTHIAQPRRPKPAVVHPVGRPSRRLKKIDTPIPASTPTKRWLRCPECGHLGSLPYHPRQDGCRFCCSVCGATIPARRQTTAGRNG